MHGGTIKIFIIFIFHYSEHVIVYNNKYINIYSNIILTHILQGPQSKILYFSLGLCMSVSTQPLTDDVTKMRAIQNDFRNNCDYVKLHAGIVLRLLPCVWRVHHVLRLVQVSCFFCLPCTYTTAIYQAHVSKGVRCFT
jgi:hypothetical protein